MKTVAILQARMNSSRLPGKMLLPLLDKPLVQHVIERTMRAMRVHEVVLAFPVLDYEAFRALHQTGCSLYAYPGDENDLIGRYLGAAQAYEADIIVRIPCDNPCVDPLYINTAIDTYRNAASVFYTNTTGLHGVHALDGVGCEVFSMSRVKWMDQYAANKPEWREHPHQCFRKYRDYELPNATIRLDVNTQADYEFIKDIYEHFQRNDFTAAEILGYLHTKEASHEKRESITQQR